MLSKWWFTALCALMLIGCGPMEQQSDLPEKKSLPSISKNMSIKKIWSISTGHGAGKGDARLVLARDGSTLYTVDRHGDLSATNDTNGVPLWNIKLDLDASAGPAIGAGKIIIGTSNGKLLALDVDTGKHAWDTTTSGEILSVPKVTDEMVLVQTMDGGLIAFNVEDGRQLWRFSHNLPALVLRRSSTPIVTDNYVIAGFSTGKLIALNKHDGTVVWIQDIGQAKGRTDLQRMVDISADPLLGTDVVYAASYQGSLVALNINTGHIVWDRDISSYSGLATDDTNLYVAATKGDVIAIDRASGHTLWLQNSLQGRRLSKPAIMGNYIIVGDNDGVVHWLDKQTGNLVGRTKIDKAGVEATPIVHNNIVYLLGRSGKLVALAVK
jgi:outer membrane protein assembly factor BamB